MKISDEEANLLLYGLDALCDTDRDGIIRKWPKYYKKKEVQELRNRLFTYHEHPREQRKEEDSIALLEDIEHNAIELQNKMNDRIIRGGYQNEITHLAQWIEALAKHLQKSS